MFFPPVYVIICFFVEMPVGTVSYGGGCNLACHILLDTVNGLFIKDHTSSLINGCIIEIIGKTIGIKLIRKVGWSGIAETIVIVHLHFARFSFLCSD